MGLVVVVPFMLTDFIVRPGARRRYLLFAAALAPAVIVRFGLGLAFSEPGDYLNETSQLMVFLGFALVGLALAGVNAVHPRRPFVVLFLVYAVCCVGSFVTPGSPLGNNIGRFFMVFGLPLLLLLRHTRLRRPFRLRRARHHPHRAVRASAVRDRDQPLPKRRRAAADHARVLRARAGGRPRPLRPQLPVPRRRAAPPLGGAVLPRGRIPHHPRLVSPGRRHPQRPLRLPTPPPSTSRGCRAWACSTSSRRCNALDPWSRREARFLGSSAAFVFVEQTGAWLIYRLVDAKPLLVPQPETADRRTGDILSIAHQRIVFSVTPPGTYWLKVTSSPYWVLEGGPGTVHPRSDRFMDLRLGEAGTYTLRFEATPAKVLDTAAGRFGL